MRQRYDSLSSRQEGRRVPAAWLFLAVHVPKVSGISFIQLSMCFYIEEKDPLNSRDISGAKVNA
jgi:hypothetical protein